MPTFSAKYLKGTVSRFETYFLTPVARINQTKTMLQVFLLLTKAEWLLYELALSGTAKSQAESLKLFKVIVIYKR